MHRTCRPAILVVALTGVLVGRAPTLPAQQAGGIGAGRGLAGAGTPLSAFSARKAETLLHDVLPCLGCHLLNDQGGRIGPDLSTVRQRRSAEYVARMIADPQGVVPGGAMPLTPMPAATRELITRYLAAQPEGSSPAFAPVTPPAPLSGLEGAVLYSRLCTACHGERGRGDGPNAASLPVKPAQHASREAMSKRPDDSLYDTIAGGGAIMNRSPRMPAYGATLTRAQIRSLVRHIRELCGCSGPAWSADGARSPQ